MITLREGPPPRESLLALYNDVGWSAYTRDPERLVAAVERSLLVIGAYEGEALLGLARVVGDGLTIVYLQDLLVRRDRQRQGIGRQLLEAVAARYADVRQLVLLTDDTPATRTFYQRCGLTACDDGQLVAFSRR